MAAFSKQLQSLPAPYRQGILIAVIALLLARSKAFSLSKFAKTSLRTQRSTPQEIAEALQRVYSTERDGSKSLVVPFRDRISKVTVVPLSETDLQKDAIHFPPTPKSHKPNVDSTFLRQLLSIMRIAFPHWRSKEVAIVIMHSAFLVLRTILSVGVARLDGRIVRDLVSADAKGFLKGLGLWFLLAIPSTYTNTMIRHLQSKLALRLRTRVTRYTHDLYFSSAPHLRYYRVAHEGGLEGIDQYITSDIAAFCESLSALYGNMMKPTLDMVIFTSQLARSLGVTGSILLFLNYFATASILRAVTPAFGRLAAVEARLEGEYRAGVGRVGREAEEVAFYGGGGRERDILFKAYLRLIKHVNSIYKIRIAYEWTEDYVIKYLWSAAGYCLISVPVLLSPTRSIGVQAPDHSLRIDNAVASRTENYISSRRLLLSLADAGGRLMYAYKDLLELAGLTTRLYSLLSTLHHLPPLPEFEHKDDAIEFKGVVVAVPGRNPTLAPEEDSYDGGLSNSVDERRLVRDLDLRVGPGEHLMISGSNGVGKTAVARVLAGLWAAEEGVIARPERGVKGVMVVPQRSYMVVGTLRDQIIYPHSYSQFRDSGRTDEDLMDILKVVHLAYLPEREGGWTTRKEWRDVLSGGEKQRMGMARVFYHLPKFAVLDECTSAVSSDVEGLMYQHAKDLGITLITISHRPTLTKYHTRLLNLAGDSTSSWTLTTVGTAEERMGIDREILNLEAKLREVSEWEKRVKELGHLLGVTGTAKR